MKTIVHIDLNDEGRESLASTIEGKPVKRLATRQEVTSFVQGVMDHAVNGVQEALTPGTQTRESGTRTLRMPTDLQLTDARNKARNEGNTFILKSYIAGLNARSFIK